MKTNFLTNLKVFRYSYWETKTMFFNLLEAMLFLSDRYKIFTSD